MAEFLSAERYFIDQEVQRVRRILAAQIDAAKDALSQAEAEGDAAAAQVARQAIARAEAELKPLQRG